MKKAEKVLTQSRELLEAWCMIFDREDSFSIYLPACIFLLNVDTCNN